MSDVKIVYIKSVPHIYIDGHEIHGVFRFEIGQSHDHAQTFHLDLYPSWVKIEYSGRENNGE